MPVESIIIFNCYTSDLVKMHELATCGEIVGLALPSGKLLIIRALTDDLFLFLKTTHDNIAKAMDVWNVFVFASGLHINMRKLMLIRCTESELVDLGWVGQILDQGCVSTLRLPYWC